jgi:hypothetical protein
VKVCMEIDRKRNQNLVKILFTSLATLQNFEIIPDIILNL